MPRWIGVEGTHPDANGVGVAEIAPKDRRTAIAAEALLATVLRLPILEAILPFDDMK
jgi:hypothetical protein